MGQEVLEKIFKLLNEKNVQFEHLTHEHVHRSEDAAKIRGNTVSQAAKAIILKVKPRAQEYKTIQCVLPGDKKIDLKKLKNLLDLKSASLASPEEVYEKTTCVIGSVPPFGTLFNLEVYVSKDILNQEIIFFSAGTHNDSIKMKSKDYIMIINPVLIDFS